MNIQTTPPSEKDGLSAWLQYMGSIHVSAIDMGLSRVSPVYEKLGLADSAPYVFMVAGTNGKGSTTATIAEICQQAGYKTALYQSPHLVSFNERVRIDGQMVDDQTLIDAFVTVETARQACQLSLSFFEMTTLAALVIFKQADCDVWVLEVGLGGRLDVVNLVTPDVCVITNVAIDHVDWLGDTREAIGKEKAGILRQNSTLIYGENDMPNSVTATIQEKAVTAYQLGVDFSYHGGEGRWVYHTPSVSMNLPYPKLALVNASVAVSAVLASTLKIDGAAIRAGLSAVQLAGRFDKRTLHGRHWLFDVAHNEAGVRFLLSQFLPLWQTHKTQYPNARLHAVFSMLADKDISAVLSILHQADLPMAGWHIATIDNPRAMQADALKEKLSEYWKKETIFAHEDLSKAAFSAVADSTETDLILVFGSFHTISETLTALGAYRDFKAV